MDAKLTKWVHARVKSRFFSDEESLTPEIRAWREKQAEIDSRTQPTGFLTGRLSPPPFKGGTVQMGLFKKNLKPREVTGIPKWQRAASRDMLIEGRRQCDGCWLYFVPSGSEQQCSTECAEKVAKWNRKRRPRWRRLVPSRR